MSASDLAERLRQALDAAAEGVYPAPDAYQRALAEWRRRERRRRLVALLLACLVFAVSDGVALWALNQGPQSRPVIFDGPPPAVIPGTGGEP